jgi:hypothetical protein
MVGFRSIHMHNNIIVIHTNRVHGDTSSKAALSALPLTRMIHVARVTLRMCTAPMVHQGEQLLDTRPLQSPSHQYRTRDGESVKKTESKKRTRKRISEISGSEISGRRGTLPHFPTTGPALLRPFRSVSFRIVPCTV